jgi:hypothetical protein
MSTRTIQTLLIVSTIAAAATKSHALVILSAESTPDWVNRVNQAECLDYRASTSERVKYVTYGSALSSALALSSGENICITGHGSAGTYTTPGAVWDSRKAYTGADIGQFIKTNFTPAGSHNIFYASCSAGVGGTNSVIAQTAAALKGTWSGTKVHGTTDVCIANYASIGTLKTSMARHVLNPSANDYCDIRKPKNYNTEFEKKTVSGLDTVASTCTSSNSSSGTADEQQVKIINCVKIDSKISSFYTNLIAHLMDVGGTGELNCLKTSNAVAVETVAL